MSTTTKALVCAYVLAMSVLAGIGIAHLLLKPSSTCYDTATGKVCVFKQGGQ